MRIVCLDGMPSGDVMDKAACSDSSPGVRQRNDGGASNRQKNQDAGPGGGRSVVSLAAMVSVGSGREILL